MNQWHSWMSVALTFQDGHQNEDGVAALTRIHAETAFILPWWELWG